MASAYNPTDSPVVVDAEGHILGGGEHGDADPDFDGTSVLLFADDVPDNADEATTPKRSRRAAPVKE